MKGPLLTALLLVVAWVAPLRLAQAEPDEDSSGLSFMSLSELNEELARRETDLRRYADRLAALENDNEKIKRKLALREASLQRQETKMRQAIILLARLTRGGYLQLLRGAETWAELVQRVQVIRAAMNEQLEELRQHQRLCEDLRQQKEDLRLQVQKQQELSERVSAYRKLLLKEREDRRQHSGWIDGPVEQTADAEPDFW